MTLSRDDTSSWMSPITTGRYMRVVTASFVLVVLSCAFGCAGEARVTADDSESCMLSLKEVGAAGIKADSAQFATAFGTIVGRGALAAMGNAMSELFSDIDNGGATVDPPPPDSISIQRAMCKTLDGLTAQDIMAAPDSLAESFGRAIEEEGARAHFESLIAAKEAYELVADSLSEFKITSARLQQSPGFVGLDVLIVLAVENGTRHAVSRAFFTATAVSPGRSVPWLQETFNHTIPGGIEPGESATWRLEPNMFQGDWAKVRVPASAEFNVDVVRLQGADGEDLWGGARFSPVDQRVLDSLTVRFKQ